MPRNNFLKLHVSATDNFTGNPIPATNLTIGSTSYGRADSNGDIYVPGEDNKWYDGTVFADQTRYSNYTFALTPQSAYLQITRGTNNLAGQTNTVIVGEQVALTCQFVDPATGLPSSIAPITNFQWTVPGNVISNWDGSGSASLLLTNVPKTNSTIYFYWYQPATDLEVQCTAIAKGVTMTAKTNFKVLAPSYSLSICSSNSVAVDANYQGAPGIYLHFGDRENAPGVVFRATPATLVQSSNEFNLDILQVINSLTAKRWSNGILQMLSMTNVIDAGIDVYDLGNDVVGSDDSPAEPAKSSFSAVSRDDSFSLYVMYQSATPGSIWVPISVAAWSWNGMATNNPGWTLVSSHFIPTNCLTGSSASGFPSWTNRFSNLITNW